MKIDQFTTVPDFIPEGQEELYPALGGVFHDFVPEGQSVLDGVPVQDAETIGKLAPRESSVAREKGGAARDAAVRRK